MRIINKKQAYTLAEIMVVMLVLTIIFAAFAPMFTKRKISSYKSKYNVWEYADRVSLDAYYDPGDPSYTGQLFFGVTPETKDSVESTFLPYSKIVLRAGEVTSDKLLQRHIQFRFGRVETTDNGRFAGTWFVNGKNALLGGSYANINTDSTGARNNVSVGYDALTKLVNATNNVAVGYNAFGRMANGKDNVAVGYLAGYKLDANNNGNTFIGAYAGDAIITKGNTAIGYAASGKTNANPNNNQNVFGQYNTFIGAYAAQNNENSDNNVAIGANALRNITMGENNIALGAGALENLTRGHYNVAIGYKACSEVTTGSKKTCIGANSGPHKDTTGEKFLSASTDAVERTYIGSKPKNFGGDAVLEIHNVDTPSEGIQAALESSVTTGTTTIINGNLIVRGRPFFTVGSTLHHFHDRNTYLGSSLSAIRTYGYGSGTGGFTNTSYYAKCASDQKTYSFNSRRCIPLDTSSTSDRRLKNIGSLNNSGLDEIKQLKVYNYTFKDDKNKTPHVGVLAQELQKVFPNSVFEGSDGYLRIRWDEMFYAAINAIKTLDRKITALTERITNVDKQITQLENENAQLQNQVDTISKRIQKLKVQ